MSSHLYKIPLFGFMVKVGLLHPRNMSKAIVRRKAKERVRSRASVMLVVVVGAGGNH